MPAGQTGDASASAPPASVLDVRTEENTSVDTADALPAARPASEVTLASKRLDDLGESARESADLLTADRASIDELVAVKAKEYADANQPWPTQTCQ